MLDPGTQLRQMVSERTIRASGNVSSISSGSSRRADTISVRARLNCSRNCGTSVARFAAVTSRLICSASSKVLFLGDHVPAWNSRTCSAAPCSQCARCPSKSLVDHSRVAPILHLLLAERVKTGEQLIENAAFLLDQH